MKPNKHDWLKQPDSGFDVSSLIDVCFLLLIYFVCTSTIVPRERDLGMPLPRPGEGVQPASQPLVIHIGKSGAVSTGIGAGRQLLDCDPAVRDVPLLASTIELYKGGVEAAGESPMVMIHADSEATHQRVVDVLNALAGANISSITLAEVQAAD